MKSVFNQAKFGVQRWAAVVLAAFVIWALVSGGFDSRPARASDHGTTSPITPTTTCPLGQCFQDVPPSNPFYDYINSLYQLAIVSGYACGSVPGEPCVAPYNRPYYRPTNTVNRQQMAKYTDLARKTVPLILQSPAFNIGALLVVSGATNADLVSPIYAQVMCDGCGAAADISAIHGVQTSNGDDPSLGAGVNGESTTIGGQGVRGDADVGYGVLGQGGTGVEGRSNTGIGVVGNSTLSKGIEASSGNAGSWSLYVDAAGGDHNTQSTYIEGKLTVENGCTGCVGPDIVLQNMDSEALEEGDLVSVFGSRQADDPLIIQVRKANGANDTALVGVAGQALYLPDSATVAAYRAQRTAYEDASNRRDAALMAGDTSAAAAIVVPPVTIDGKSTEIHTLENADNIAVNGYAWLLTDGTIATLKVDASMGSIHAGDLLTTSPNVGYAMKVVDRAQASGAIIGKALADLATGTGKIPVLVTLK